MKTGVDVIKESLASDLISPGVYQFINKNKEIIYIGKAKNLRKRLSSYLRADSVKTEIVVQNICDVVILKTLNETEALILEASLIRKYKPKYNILLKDDKSFPYITIDEQELFPKIIKYRGKDLKDKIVYGPFPSVKDLDKAIELLQKLFLLRSCSDVVFRNRKKPCILYQMQQCSAPCVNNISIDAYKAEINKVKDFLSGHRKSLYDDLFLMMNKASNQQDYELAAKYRDRINILSQITKNSHSLLKDIEDVDVICINEFMDQIIVQVSFIRLGAITGHKVFVFNVLYESLGEVLCTFLSNFYSNQFVPDEILLSLELEKSYQQYIEDLLYKIYNKHYKINVPSSRNKTDIVEYCMSVLESKKAETFESFNKHQLFIAELESLLQIKSGVRKIEIFDNSHCFGSYAVGAIVASGINGFQKSQYRRYNIKSIKGADDYAMLHEVLTRRFSERNKYNLPDLMIIDGGKGHLKVVVDFLSLHCINDIFVVSIAKGRDRNSGNEVIYTRENTIILDKSSKVKQYIQLLRDEAHRVAISGYRNRALSSFDQSILDNIPGIGKVRKQKLLTFFGSVKNLKEASLEEIRNVTGIDSKISKMIYQYLNKDL
ncbi:MAG: excinuclease ABC subunit UvrC [Rickettsiales bacterium]|nr:excinuclease ABC subunit UvrC [Rickettsiales bacterium]